MRRPREEGRGSLASWTPGPGAAPASSLAVLAGLLLATWASAQPGEPTAAEPSDARQATPPQGAVQAPSQPAGRAPVGLPAVPVPDPGAAGGGVDASAAEPPVVHASPWAAWDAGDYAQALQGFSERQTERPDDPGLSLNTGAAHYRLQDFESADAQFHRAASIGDDALRAEALYNLGNSAFRQGKLGEAADYYMASLEANPDDLDAKFNLEFVRQELERQPPEQGEENQDTQQDEQQDEQQGNERQRDEEEGDEQQQDGDEQQDQEGNESAPEDREGEQDQQDRQDQAGDQSGQDPRDADGQPEEADGQGAEAPAPGMTPEEAERTLQALEEGRPDPTRRGQRGRRSRQARDW